MSRLQDSLGLRQAPIAIGFFDAPPAGVPRWSGGPVPAGCSFWPDAVETPFYTAQSDHYNCAIGAHTLNIPLPAERSVELMQAINFMVDCRYLALEEVAGIPTLPASPQVVAYGPADNPGFAPAAYLIACQPAQAMLIYEAAIKAGAAGGGMVNSLGRPACAVLPLSLRTGEVSLSFGCRGNRTFTGLPDDEAYVCVPAPQWAAVLEKLVEVTSANETMGAFYAEKKATFNG
jgi:uncharacterized protein (DUF169 family)